MTLHGEMLSIVLNTMLTRMTWNPSWLHNSGMPNRPCGASYDDVICGCVELNDDASGDHVATVRLQPDLITGNRRMLVSTYKRLYKIEQL